MTFVSPNIRVAARQLAEAENYNQALRRASPKIVDTARAFASDTFRLSSTRCDRLFGALLVVTPEDGAVA